MLAVENLCVKFGGLAAVDRLSFETAGDEVLSVIGPNGAGKTTLFNAISGFVRPTSGRVTFEGRDITRLRAHQIARLGLVRTFQKKSFFPDLTVMENIITGLREREAAGLLRLWGALSRIGPLERRAEEILDMVGLTTRPHAEADSLPYGEQRLLGIALSLTVDPKLLMLDEPCAGMNPTEVDRMSRVLPELCKAGISIVVVEHQMRFVMGISDRVLVLDHGVKLTEGRPQEVRSDQKVIEAYLGRGS
jgi:branched-chain amino acid transport system ATP-binding protein